MKTLDLNAYGVQEMNSVEMKDVYGGNIFTAIGNAIVVAAEWVADAAVTAYEYVKTHYVQNSDGTGAVTF